MRRRLIGLALSTLVVVAAFWGQAAAQGVQCGGAFLPNLNCIITGQWTWTQASPWILEGTTANAFETTIAVTDPTADRTITLPNATGVVMLGTGSTITGVRAGTTTLDGSNPTSVTTGLSAITGCTVQQALGSTPGDDPIGFTNIWTASAGRLDIYAYKTNGSDPTWVASTDAVAVIGYVCIGSA